MMTYAVLMSQYMLRSGPLDKPSSARNELWKRVRCTEWESKEALHEHLKTKEFTEFCKFVHESNIPMKLAMAIPIESMEIFE